MEPPLKKEDIKINFFDADQSNKGGQAPKVDPRTGMYTFPGLDGIPFRGDKPYAPITKEGDPISPKVVTDGRARVFDMSDDQDLTDYADLWSKLSSNPSRYILGFEEKQYNPQAKSWLVFMRWGEKWLEIPK